MYRKIFTVDHGSYDFDVLVALNISDDELVAYIRKNYKPSFLGEGEAEFRVEMDGRGKTCILPTGQTILRVNDKNKVGFHSTLAHEIFHAVEFLFDKINVKHNFEISGEAFAYQIDYLTGSIYEKLYKLPNIK